MLDSFLKLSQILLNNIVAFNIQIPSEFKPIIVIGLNLFSL